MKKRADGRYQKRIIINGKVKYFYGKTKAQIDRQIVQYKIKDDIGRSYSEIAEEWMDEHYPTLASNSLKGLKPAVRRSIENFGHVPVREILAKDISNYIKSICKMGYAQKTVLTHLQAVRQILAHAVLCGDVDFNTAESVTIPKNLPKVRREPPKPETLRFIREHSELPFSLFALIALYTGARRGEILALQYKDIDRENGYVNISKSIYYENNKPYIKTPKTQAGIREIVLIKQLEELIPNGRPNDYIFQEHNYIITNKRFELQWKKYISFLPEHITPHQLRHAFATRLYELGVDIKSAQYQLGHADIKTTTDIYTHITEAKKKLTAEKLVDF